MPEPPSDPVSRRGDIWICGEHRVLCGDATVPPASTGRAGCAVCLPLQRHTYLSNDILKANYSNSRLALLEFRRRIEAYQHAVMVWQLCRRVWTRWMDTAGVLELPSYDERRREYLACSWLPPKWDWVDPLKDAHAEIEQIDAGLKSRSQALAERGYDAEQVDAEIAADKTRERTLGLTFNATTPIAPNSTEG